MPIIDKVVGGRAQLAKKVKPSLRLYGGWLPMGAFTREADTRTTKQLLANIDYFAERLPEVALFRKELKAMKPEHLGLVSDICELGAGKDLINKNINIRELAFNGKSLLAFLMEKLPWASKENPEMLNFTQEVINQTDTTASKYFLGTFAGVFEHPEVGRHLAATRPLVKDIAQVTLRGGYIMDYSKERNFVKVISEFINPSINSENIKTLQLVNEIAEKQGQSIDAIGFIRNNVNLY